VRAEFEDHGCGFDAEVLVGTTGHWKALPDAIGQEQGTEVLRRHRDRRMRFIHEVNLVLFGIEVHAARSERRQTNGLGPLQGAGFGRLIAKSTSIKGQGCRSGRCAGHRRQRSGGPVRLDQTAVNGCQLVRFVIGEGDGAGGTRAEAIFRR
jgi:hypothetical protein